MGFTEQRENSCTSRPRFVLLHFIVLHGCCVSYKLKARPSPRKRITARFIVIFTLLGWSGTEPTVSPRYPCIEKQDQQEEGTRGLHLSTIAQRQVSGGLVEGYCPPVFLPFFIGQGEKTVMLMGGNAGCMVPGGQHFGCQLFVDFSGEISCPSLEDRGAHGNLLNPYQGRDRQCTEKLSVGVAPQQGDGMPSLS